MADGSGIDTVGWWEVVGGEGRPGEEGGLRDGEMESGREEGERFVGLLSRVVSMSAVMVWRDYFPDTVDVID